MGRILEFNGTVVLQKTIEAEQEGFKLIVHQGGSRSSKTYSILQFLILKAISNQRITITIVRSKLTWVKSTILKDFADLTREYNIEVTPEVNPNRAEQIYDINGTEFAFFGCDYAEKLHGRKQDWFWINEVMEVGKKDFDQLEMRTTTGGIIDYNPADDTHWVFDLQKRNDVKVITSTMLDNPFLPQSIITKIQGYEPTPLNIANGTADNYMWQVYGLGNKAKLEGAILTNWDIVESIPTSSKFLGYGLDFGYTNDPTALVEVYIQDNELYVNELLYDTGMTNRDIVKSLEDMGLSRQFEVFADSSEPKSIDEICSNGWNIKPVVKGADSILYGLDILKTHRIHITQKSVNLENELRKYKWSEDKNGKSLNKPIGKNDHLIDALRYLVMMKLGIKEKLVDIDVF